MAALLRSTNCLPLAIPALAIPALAIPALAVAACGGSSAETSGDTALTGHAS
jgi:uncharacterized membrane protein